jgi:alcohol dehydrogenase (NADP+)
MTTQFSPELHGQYKAKAYAAANATSPLVPFTIPRRNPGEHDIQIEILFCGICHSDLNQVRNVTVFFVLHFSHFVLKSVIFQK